MELIAEQLDLDFQEIKSKILNPDESAISLDDAQKTIGGIIEEPVENIIAQWEKRNKEDER